MFWNEGSEVSRMASKEGGRQKHRPSRPLVGVGDRGYRLSVGGLGLVVGGSVQGTGTAAATQGEVWGSRGEEMRHIWRRSGTRAACNRTSLGSDHPGARRGLFREPRNSLSGAEIITISSFGVVARRCRPLGFLNRARI
ncbi:hypothetical protein M758_7G064200 [Ceratodon purpureus]|nr:hypothetical protein M758_7G064200 [Ceratodon purpureus]